jgi:hypothetical protein
LYYELRSQFLSAIDVDWDGYVDECEDKYLLRELHGATVNTILRDAYVEITSHEDWRQVDALGRLAQWEDSSIQKLIAFELAESEKIPERLIGELLKSIAGGDQGAFQSLIKYREVLNFDWPV